MAWQSGGEAAAQLLPESWTRVWNGEISTDRVRPQAVPAAAAPVFFDTPEDGTDDDIEDS